MESTILELNQRVLVEGFVGTIRYIGPLKHDPSANDTIYVGIEWDDEYRGKHNGTVSG